MKANKTIVVLLFLLSQVSFSQHKRIQNQFLHDFDGVPTIRSCYTMQADSVLRAKCNRGSITDYETKMKEIVSAYMVKKSLLRTESDTIIIPVIVHIIHNGDLIGSGPNLSIEQVNSQFDVLNEDYNKKANTPGYNTNAVGASMMIKFLPATKAPDGTDMQEPGIDRYNGGQSNWALDEIENTLKPNTQWDPTKYFNIWTVRFGGSLASTLGYTQFPSLSSLDGLNMNEGAANTDGVVIRYNAFGRTGNVKAPYNLGRTTTHETGHFFGLRHIWGDAYNCTGTDYCDDTPQTTDALYGCPSNPPSCTFGVEAMYQNYLDYTSDACMNIFTNDQRNRMMAVIQNSPRRKELLTSNVYQPLVIPKANFSASQLSACKGTSIIFTNNSLRMPDTWNWTIYNRKGNIITTITSNNFVYQFDSADSYSVKLIVSNQFGADTLLKVNYIEIISDSLTILPFQENFETTTILSNWILYNPAGDSTWKVSTNASAYGIGLNSIFYNNYDSTYNQTGIENGLISSKFDFQNNLNAYLTFDVAYARFYTYSDSLAIYYTSDCGQTYNLLWQKGGENLATAPDLDHFFVPTSTQWRKEQISLKALNGMPNINFMILNKSGWSNAVYVDNIAIIIPNPVSVPGSDFSASIHSVCGGGSITFSDQSTEYPTAWAWTLTEKDNKTSPILSNDQNPEVIFNTAGTYNVRLVASNSFGSGTEMTKSSYIKVSPSPVITLSASATDVTCHQMVTFNALGGVKYAWFNDKSLDPITTFTGSSFTDTLKYTTNYYVNGQDVNGCLNTSNDVKISVSGSCSITGTSTTGVTNSESKNINKIYPNPAESNVFIEVSEQHDNFIDFNFILYNLQSHKVFERPLIKGLNSFSLIGLAKGLYFYTIGYDRGKLLIE